MNSDESANMQPAAPVASHRVSISRYVNEQFPNWDELLSAHDVARLTRRPRWVVLSLTLLGRFPRKQRYHGCGVGWLKADVIAWIGRSRVPQIHIPCHAYRRRHRRGTRQHELPLDWRLSHGTSRGHTFARRIHR
jgi:predicted DNA-binding transcriptional regulator AlpA